MEAIIAREQIVIERMQNQNCGDRERDFLQALNPPIDDGVVYPTIWAWPCEVAGEKNQQRYDKGIFGLLNCGNYWEKPYWWVRKTDGAPVGMIKVNRSLDSKGIRINGHILLSIAEPYRNQGYGTATIMVAKDALSLPDCLCVVGEENSQMRHIIERCGGKLWDTVTTPYYTYTLSRPHNGHKMFCLREHPDKYRKLCRYWL